MKAGSLATLLSLGFAALIIHSCCKEYCSDENIFAVDFHGFTAAELEKIKIVSYKDGNITVPVDSYYVSSNNIVRSDTTRIFPDRPLQSNFNFQIIVENPALNYILTDIETTSKNCNCGSGTYKMVSGYKLNGMRYAALNGNPLVIKK